MLPDYPESKAKLRKLLTRPFSTLPNTGIFSQIPKRHYFEGDKMGIIREDGTVEVSRFTTFKSEVNFDVKKLENATTQDIARMLQGQADQLHFQQNKAMFEKVEEVVSSAGNSVNLRGQPLTPEVFLELFERIQTDFDDDGNPYMPTIVCSTEAGEMFKKVMQQIEADSTLRSRAEEIMRKKRSDWRDRESCRKLVG